MSSRSERHSPVDASSLPVPHVMRAGAVAALSVVLFITAVSGVGWVSPAWQASADWPGWFQAVSECFMRFFEGAERLVTGGKGGAGLSLRLLCVLLLTLSFMTLRRWMLQRNAYKPGPVDVQQLVSSTTEGEPCLEGLTAQLRKQLSETNLYPPSALPAESPAENFLDLLGDIDLEPKKLGTSILRLFSRLRPKVAYTVRGVLRVREQEPAFGITVTVTSYAMRGSRTETLWHQTWEDAVRAAGYWVMAALVPVTQASRRAPWEEWRGRNLQPELFAAYQEARELSHERKFDDALDRYYAALRLDPTNLHLRTQIAGTQEKLWLHLDALETYHGAILLDGQSRQQRSARLKRGSWNPRRSFCRRYRWWRNGLLEARFRYAVVLGMAERTADEWCRPTVDPADGRKCPRRAHTRREIRRSLAPSLVDRYWPTLIHLTPPGEKNPILTEKSARKWLADELGEDRLDPRKVSLIFQLACQEEMYQLVNDYPLLRFLRNPSRRRSRGLTWTSLRINRDVWAPLRLAWAVKQTEEGWVGGLRNELSWPMPGKELKNRVEEARGWGMWRWTTERLRTWQLWLPRPWQDSYNTACIYAAAMRGHEDESELDLLARLAVEELEAAARADVTGFHPITRSWLLIEDPDLEALRPHPRFLRFERETYPHDAPDRDRPPRPLRVEMMAYDRQMLSGTAQVMEHMWRLRGRLLPAETYLITDWFTTERLVWQGVHRVAADQGQDWRDREKLVQTVRAIADSTLLAKYGLPTTLPELDDLLDDATWFGIGDAKDSISGFERSFRERLSMVSRAIGGASNAVSPIRRSDQWVEAVKHSGTLPNSMMQHAVLQACADYENTWRALRDVLDPDDDELALSKALHELHEPEGVWRLLATLRTRVPAGFRHTG
ncbi:hypothetical protein [Streptomyces solicathayae]|uniref:Tetratricopeptide repeat protein n=1 Tax=Streptomyces solicathayae TaxID=3081768 RepID=A0ABZ0LQK8_9ACTN|nr:hypothetical protein [Streptomyces sp. HUAS YS2]WOX21074.1 hypothetical protein R2D22_06605 [Streptomyces sp. HUAS YS2]